MTNLLKLRLQAIRGIFQKLKLFRPPAAGKVPGNRFVPKSMDRRWIMRRGPELLGWPGVIGAGLLAACAAFYVSAIFPAQGKLSAIRLDVLALQDQAQRESQAPTAGQPAPGEALVRFYQSFPQDKDLPLWLEKIFASAQIRKIEIDRGEYKVSSDKEGGFVRFQMTFPVKGEYPRIRKYLSSLMSDIPTLSLQQVQFKREKVGDTMVEANIRMVLYLLEQKS
jgi:hypothetical protein